MIGTSQIFYESGASNGAEKGRLILISWHFPPDSAAGALRWQKLAGYAAERGWGLDVFTREPSEIEGADPARLEDLPPGIRLYGVSAPVIAVQRIERGLWGAFRRLIPAREAASGTTAATTESPARRSSLGNDELRFDPFSLRTWIRSYHGWELYAAHRAWARRAAKLARGIFDPALHRVAISCGPPHGAHAGARQLSRETGIPYVIDMRDLWSHLERWGEPVASPTTPWFARLHERPTIARASLVVTNTEPARAAMQRLYPKHAERIITVMNGYDDDEDLPAAQRDGCFRLAYAGTIYLDRNPRTLFRAVRRVIDALGLAPGDLAIEFMGPAAQLDGVTLEDLARESGIESYVEVRHAGTRREAAEFLARASVLVNLPQDSHLAIPSKVFEYMRFECWLLALAAPDSATEMVLRGTGADVAAPDDVEGIAEILQRRYREHREGRVPPALAAHVGLSRRAQAEHLFDALEAILGQGSRHVTRYGPRTASPSGGADGAPR